MKNRKIEIGIIAALSGGFVAMQGCSSQSDQPIDVNNNMNPDSIKLEQRLKELSQTNYTGELAWGAMCYDPMAPAYMDYTCSHCGEIIKEKYDNWIVFTINKIDEIVTRIKNLGYDVVLDKMEFCPNCSKNDHENPELIFKMRFSTKAHYHIAKSNIINEYLCLLAFLSNQDTYLDTFNNEYALHDNIAIIQKMTGLGKDLKIGK